jgi:protein-S-isoprenylcysteine O-methyltransferase Ste14
MSDRRRGRLLVGAQFLLLGLIGFAPGDRLWRGSGWLIALSALLLFCSAIVLAFSFAHLGPALTANPVPKVDAPLQTGGAYSYVRHPIYTSVLTFGFGVAIYRGTPIGLFAFLALVLLLNFKARWEEKFLSAKHQGYSSYANRVPRFFPNLRQRWNMNGR